MVDAQRKDVLPIADWSHEFPGLASAAYLDSAAESLGSHTLAAALERYARVKSRGSPGREELYATDAACRQRLASILRCSPEELAFVSSTTEAINRVLMGIDWRPGDNLVLSDLEFPGAIVACLGLRDRMGVELRLVRRAGGIVDTAALAKQIDERTRLVLVSHVSYRSGYRIDLQSVADCAHASGARLLVDSAQSLGAMPINLDGVDFLAGCTFKWLLGAHGMGLLYVRAELTDELRPLGIGWRGIQDYFGVLPDLHYDLQRDARRFEGGMPNYAGSYALHDTLGLLGSVGFDAVERRILALSERILDGLERLGIVPLTPRDADRRAGIVAFETPEYAEIGRWLEGAGIVAWCKEGRVRASTHFYCADAHVDAFLERLASFPRPIQAD
jgi:cysteine desulfurase / selenocysteine lyase